MMEDAQSMEALRHSHSCLRDRIIAGMARKNNVPQERGRKRGRRCGTASSALGEFFAPAVGTAFSLSVFFLIAKKADVGLKIPNETNGRNFFCSLAGVPSAVQK